MLFSGMFAMHAHLFGEIMDIEPDRASGRRTTATVIGRVPAKLLIAALLGTRMLAGLRLFSRRIHGRVPASQWSLVFAGCAAGVACATLYTRTDEVCHAGMERDRCGEYAVGLVEGESDCIALTTGQPRIQSPGTLALTVVLTKRDVAKLRLYVEVHKSGRFTNPSSPATESRRCRRKYPDTWSPWAAGRPRAVRGDGRCAWS